MFHITDWSKVEGSSVGDVVDLTGIVIKQDTDAVVGNQVVVIHSEPGEAPGKAPFELWGVVEDTLLRIGERVSFEGVVSRVTDSKDVIVEVDEVEVVSVESRLSEAELDTVEGLIEDQYSV